jgi:hypothetical protein
MNMWGETAATSLLIGIMVTIVTTVATITAEITMSYVLALKKARKYFGWKHEQVVYTQLKRPYYYTAFANSRRERFF